LQTSDVVIIGGGVIGCSIAYHLAKRGIPAHVIERDDIAMGSSGACDKAVLLRKDVSGAAKGARY
jgi:sarcosine oxidase subunit beta